MNYLYYKQLRRKEMIKNTIFITFILLFACLSTYIIYNNFKEKRDEILKSNLIDVVYHTGNEVDITKVTPVTDYVGLSSKAYTFTIKNNTSRWVTYKIRVVENSEEIYNDNCANKQIPLNIIKTGIHKKGEVSKIYNLDDLDDGVLEISKVGPGEKVNYTARFWITASSLAAGTKLHYHSLLEVTAE